MPISPPDHLSPDHLSPDHLLWDGSPPVSRTSCDGFAETQAGDAAVTGPMSASLDSTRPGPRAPSMVLAPGIRGPWPCVTRLSGAAYREAQLRFTRLPAAVIVRPASAVRLDATEEGETIVDAFEVVSLAGLRLGFVPVPVGALLAADDACWFDGRLDDVGTLVVVGPRLDPGPDPGETVEVLARSPRRRQAALARDRFTNDDGWLEDPADDDGRPLTPEFASSGRLLGWQIPLGDGVWVLRRVRAQDH
jgi:hypothetical protein